LFFIGDYRPFITAEPATVAAALITATIATHYIVTYHCALTTHSQACLHESDS